MCDACVLHVMLLCFSCAVERDRSSGKSKDKHKGVCVCVCVCRDVLQRSKKHFSCDPS